MTIGQDAEASACGYVYLPAGGSNGVAAFSFEVPAEGNSHLWGRVKGLSWYENSFYVSIDGGSEFHYEIPQFGNGWTWG